MAARPRRYKDAKQISLRLDNKLLEQLDRRAEELRLDRSQLINRLLEKHIADSNPFALTDKELGEIDSWVEAQRAQRLAAEDPGDYAKKLPEAPETRPPTRDDPLPGRQTRPEAG